MSIYEKCKKIEECIGNITDVSPELYCREETSSIMVTWKGIVPDEETTKKIAEALKKFGNPLPNHFRDCNFVSFTL